MSGAHDAKIKSDGLDTRIRALRSLDWNDLGAVELESTRLLDILDADRALLGAMVARIPSEQRLANLCEHYDILDKLVVHDDESGFRVRLHVFQPGYFDRPHNHRWTYTSRILRGSYRHFLFGADTDFREGIDVREMTPMMIRTEVPGSTYSLRHDMVHSVTAEAHAVSLIVRGPAVKDRFLVADRATNKVWWQYGAARESQAEASAKRMSRVQIEECANLLSELAVTTA